MPQLALLQGFWSFGSKVLTSNMGFEKMFITEDAQRREYGDKRGHKYPSY